MKYAIQIPKPCHEPWNKMSAENNGRHCSQCSKTVVDFTQWEKEDILQYIQKEPGKTCGRFRQEQLTTAIDPDTFISSVAHSPLPLYKKIAAILLLAFGLVQMSCNADGGDRQHIQGDSTSVSPANTIQRDTHNAITGAIAPDTLKKTEHFMMGKPAHPLKRVNHKTKAQIKFVPPILKGEVELVPNDTVEIKK
jgi:hypothetical protein